MYMYVYIYAVVFLNVSMCVPVAAKRLYTYLKEAWRHALVCSFASNLRRPGSCQVASVCVQCITLYATQDTASL